MNFFVEIVFKDPLTQASVKRLINTATINAIDTDAQGRAVLIMGGGAKFPVTAGGGSRLETFEAYGNVAARLATATQATPIATVSNTDQQAATANRQADIQTSSNSGGSTPPDQPQTGG